jgi:hypothetical protein
MPVRPIIHYDQLLNLRPKNTDKGQGLTMRTFILNLLQFQTNFYKIVRSYLYESVRQLYH